MRKYEEYLNLSLAMLRWGQVKQELIVDKYAGRQYLVLGAQPVVGEVMKLLSTELLAWFHAHPNNRDLIDWPARLGLATMLTERPDLAALMRVAETLPLDVEISAVPVDRPAVVGGGESNSLSV